MAIEMQKAARRRAISVRMGIAAGPCIVGILGCSERMEYTIIGRTVNLAARLQAAAQAGEILVDDATAQRVAGVVPTRASGCFALKGFDIPMPVSAVAAEGL